MKERVRELLRDRTLLLALIVGFVLRLVPILVWIDKPCVRGAIRSRMNLFDSAVSPAERTQVRDETRLPSAVELPKNLHGPKGAGGEGLE